jgi:hypothetical protein
MRTKAYSLKSQVEKNKRSKERRSNNIPLMELIDISERFMYLDADSG